MLHKTIGLLNIFMFLFIVGCSEKTAPTAPEQEMSHSREAVDYLSRETAQLRSRQISDVRYTLDITLNAEGDDFFGTVTVDFTLSPQQSALTLDFEQGKILAVRANGKDIDWQYNGHFITVEESALKKQGNRLEIDFTHAYSRTSEGLYYFRDPEDGKIYTYSDFEPFGANQLFPCFDQPDLKATYLLTARVPISWQVIANTLESTVKIEGKLRVWRFPQSQKFSTYLFALHAGEYAIWVDKEASVPSRLFARQSMAEYVPVDEWFKITRQGFDFFGGYFEIPYPFGKYDQIMVPDFNAGAMENVGAVTFSETYLVRGELTRSQRRDLANTNLHEMAHMWFGDLVTMRWWNGLWLNESFADFMSHLAIVEATEYQEIWQDFYAKRKQWGYAEDQLVTTHTIELPVANTREAIANFDGITYAKGGSVLKQLRHFLGEEKYRRGVGRYLKTYSWRNTELDDFLDALSAESGVDLGAWSAQWLNTPGLNTVQAEYLCEAGRIKQFSLQQTAPADMPTLRSHHVQVALFDLREKEARLRHIEPVTFSGKRTAVTGLVGQACPDLVYPNYDDWAFVKVLLDEDSSQVAETNINAFADPLLRAMLWQSLWDSVEDIHTPLERYSRMALAQIGRETNLTIISAVTGKLIDVALRTHLMGDDVFGLGRAALLRRDIENFIHAQILSAATGSDLQKLWFDNYVAAASSPEAQQQIVDWLESTTVNSWTVDQDRRWTMLLSLSRNGYENALVMAEQEREKDQSSEAGQSHIAVRASWPDSDNKAQWLRELVDGDALSFAEQKRVISSLFPAQQAKLKKTYYPELIAALPQLEKNRNQSFMRAYASSLLSGLCEPDSRILIERQQAHYEILSTASVRGLKIALQLEQRCEDMAALQKNAAVL